MVPTNFFQFSDRASELIFGVCEEVLEFSEFPRVTIRNKPRKRLFSARRHLYVSDLFSIIPSQVTRLLQWLAKSVVDVNVVNKVFAVVCPFRSQNLIFHVVSFAEDRKGNVLSCMPREQTRLR